MDVADPWIAGFSLLVALVALFFNFRTDKRETASVSIEALSQMRETLQVRLTLMADDLKELKDKHDECERRTNALERRVQALQAQQISLLQQLAMAGIKPIILEG